jgi:hypothetical protein
MISVRFFAKLYTGPGRSRPGYFQQTVHPALILTDYVQSASEPIGISGRWSAQYLAAGKQAWSPKNLRQAQNNLPFPTGYSLISVS